MQGKAGELSGGRVIYTGRNIVAICVGYHMRVINVSCFDNSFSLMNISLPTFTKTACVYRYKIDQVVNGDLWRASFECNIIDTYIGCSLVTWYIVSILPKLTAYHSLIFVWENACIFVDDTNISPSCISDVRFKGTIKLASNLYRIQYCRSMFLIQPSISYSTLFALHALAINNAADGGL